MDPAEEPSRSSRRAGIMSSSSSSSPPTKSTSWLHLLAVFILFSTGPLFWLTFSVFFSAPTEFGSNDSSQTVKSTNDEVARMQQFFELRKQSRRSGNCRNGWLNGLFCHQHQQLDGVEGKGRAKGRQKEEQIEMEMGGDSGIVIGVGGGGGDGGNSNVLDTHQPIIINEMMSKSLPQSIPKRRLRIAQIAPLAESIPPKLYGGTERMVYFLTEELVRQGHHVTLFCSNDSQTSAQQHISHPSWPALRLNPVVMDLIPHMWMMEQVRRRAEEFDILHFHTIDYLPILHPFIGRSVTTLHGIMSFQDYAKLFEVYNDVPLVSISDNQRTHLESDDPKYVGTVHHGIPADLFPFNAQSSPPVGRPYLAFLGRITEVKRPEWAIEIAVRAGVPLKIAAKVDRVDVQYWEETVKPLVEKHRDLVEYIGEITDSEKGDFLGNALALLFPIDWPEPFGLVMIESMACGTPVIARPFGSVSEVIEDGVSGVIFETIDEGVEAVKRVQGLDRAKVREAFERRFTVEKMVENYVKVYENLLNQAGTGKTEL